MEIYGDELRVETYDLIAPWANHEEIEQFGNLLPNKSGLILEAMCGTGRLLLPLMESGLSVEGIEVSKTMIDKCRAKAQQKNLNPVLYQADIANMQLEKKYSAIIISVGSIQHLHPEQSLISILKNLHSHLVADGKLLLSTFRKYPPPGENTFRIQDELLTGDNDTIKLSTEEKFNSQLQYSDRTTVYEKIKNNQVIQSETENERFFWYSDDEFKTILPQAGFNSVIAHEIVHRAYKDMRMKCTMYEAV